MGIFCIFSGLEKKFSLYSISLELMEKYYICGKIRKIKCPISVNMFYEKVFF